MATEPATPNHAIAAVDASPVDPLCHRLRTLFYVLDTARIVLQLRWIPTDANKMSDALSHENDHEDWTLWHNPFLCLESLFGSHSVDQFATAINRQCLRYNSRWHNVGSKGDAFVAKDWSSANNWANPPWSNFPRLVDFLEQLPSVHATVLVPFWPGRPWFRRLHQMAWALILVARSPSTFLAGRAGHLHMGLPRWQIVAFRVDKLVPLPLLATALSSRRWRQLARSHHLRWL